MRPDAAIVFDLDDTLHSARRLRLSGWSAVAHELERRTGLDARLALLAMVDASRRGLGEHAIAACLDRYDLGHDLLPVLEETFVHHWPRVRRPKAVTRALVGLRAMQWRLGILVNGQPSIESRKISALELGPFVDAIVYAAETCVIGKPHPDAFAAMAKQLALPADRIVVIGADERRDIGGALAAGMKAIRCDVWSKSSTPTAGAARFSKWSELPSLAWTALRTGGVSRAA